ncbi:MAG: ester cyclase [Pseudomonadota bacterium]
MLSNTQIVRDACQVVWSEGRADKVADYYAEDFVADYPMTDWGVGLDGVRQLVADVRVRLPDYREEIKLLIDGGEYIVVELLIHGTHTGPFGPLEPTGKVVSFRDVTILRLRDGKIIEQRGLTDHLSLFQQLGIKQIPSA